MSKSNLLRLSTVLLAALSADGLALAADTGSIGEPGRESGKQENTSEVMLLRELLMSNTILTKNEAIK